MQILVMIGIAILGWFLGKAGGVSILLIVLAVILGLLASDRVKETPWAKALSGFLKPALMAVAVVTVLAFLFNVLAPGPGEELINWEEWCTINLYRILKQINPPWWLYLAFLVIATWTDTHQTRWKMTALLTSGKKMLGTTVAVVTLLAGVTFFGQATVIRPAYYALRHRLFVRYNNARLDKATNVEKFVAERVVTGALRSITPDQQEALRACFLQIAQEGYSDLYDNYLAEFYAANEVKSHPLGLPPAPTELTGTGPDPTFDGDPDPVALAAAIPAEEAAASRAISLEAAARPGLEKMAKLLFGQGSDKAVSISLSYVNHLVDEYGTHFAAVMPGALNGLVEPVTQAYVSQYVDKVVDQTSSKIHWTGVPIGSPKAIAAAVALDQRQLAGKKLTHAEQRSREILQEVKTTENSSHLNALSNEAVVLLGEAQEAGALLKAHPGLDVVTITASQRSALNATLLSSQEAAKAAYEAVRIKSVKIEGSAEAMRSVEEALSHVHE